MRSKNMHYDPDNSEVIPFTRYEPNSENRNNFDKTRSARVCYNLIVVAFFFALASLLSFLVMLTMKLDQNVQFDNLVVLIPFLVFLMFATLLCNKMIAHPSNNFTGLGKFFLYFTHNTCFFFIFIFVLVLGFRLDEMISLKYSFIFIPLDLIFAIMFLFICFIFPGLLDKNIGMYQEAFMLSSYYFFTLLTIVFLTIRLDEVVHWSFYKIFIAELSLMTLHLILIIKNIFGINRATAETELLKVCVLLMMILGMLLPLLKLDGFIDLSWKLAFIPLYLLMILVAVLSTKSLLGLYRNEDSENY